jgi:hypothetical protein
MKMEDPNDPPLERKSQKGWIEIHEINGVIHGRTGFEIKTATVPRQRRQKACWRLLASHQVYIPDNGARKLFGVSYVITKFITTPESLWYTIRSQINPQARRYRCSFHPGVFQGTDFLGEREVWRTWTKSSGSMVTKDRNTRVDFR